MYNYESVSTAKLEEETGLTRGAIFFKHKSKEALFKAVVDRYVLEFKPGITEVNDMDTLKSFIDAFLADTSRRMDEMCLLGIPNVQRGSDIKIQAMFGASLKIWEDILQKAKESGEIKPTCDVHRTALQFRYLYSGMAFEDSFSKGLNLDSLRDLYYSLYDELKNEK